MTEGRYWISLDSHRYIEVVEVQRDGQPRMHISKDLRSRSNMLVDLYHNTSDGVGMTAMSQSMGNMNVTCETLIFFCRIPTSFASEKIGQILRLEYSTQAALIRKAGIEYRTLYSVYA